MGADRETFDLTGDEEPGDLWGYIADALVLKGKGEPVPDAVLDRAHDAGVLLCASALIQGGASIESVERQFTEREYTLRFTYDGEADEWGVTVDWDDGTNTTTNGKVA